MSFFSATCFRTMSATPPFINASNFSGSSARAVRISLMLVGLGSRPAWVVRILLSLRFMLELLSMVVFHRCTVVILSGDCSHLGDESDQGVITAIFQGQKVIYFQARRVRSWTPYSVDSSQSPAFES